MPAKIGHKPPKSAFKKGNPGGPGTPPNPPEIRALALESRKKATALLGEMLSKDWKEVKAIFASEDVSGFDKFTAAILIHAANGSAMHGNAILDRLYGPITQKLEVTELPLYQEVLVNGKTAEYVINYPDGSKEILGNIKD